MTLVDLHYEERQSNPVDIIEVVAALHDWSFDRSAEDELTITVAGGFAEYFVSFAWMGQLEAVHLSCSFDYKVNPSRSDEIMRLLALINERLMCGHFDYWSHEGVITYRQSLMLAGGVEPTTRQVEVMLGVAVEACEQYYQAFQFALWAGRTAQEALDCALFETKGEA